MPDRRPPPWASALHLAQQKLEQGDSAGALPYFEEAAKGAEQADASEGEMTARAGLAMALFGLGHAREAVGPARRAAELAEQLGQKAEAALFRSLVERLGQDGGEQARTPWFTALTAGQSALERGAIEEAVPHLTRAVEQARAADAAGVEATAGSLLAQCHLALQTPDDALPLARRALEIATALGQAEAVATFEKLVTAAETAIERTRQMQAMVDDAEAELARIGEDEADAAPADQKNDE